MAPHHFRLQSKLSTQPSGPPRSSPCPPLLPHLQTSALASLPPLLFQSTTRSSLPQGLDPTCSLPGTSSLTSFRSRFKCDLLREGSLVTLRFLPILSHSLFPSKHSPHPVILEIHLSVTCFPSPSLGTPTHSFVLSISRDHAQEGTSLTKWQHWN